MKNTLEQDVISLTNEVLGSNRVQDSICLVVSTETDGLHIDAVLDYEPDPAASLDLPRAGFDYEADVYLDEQQDDSSAGFNDHLVNIRHTRAEGRAVTFGVDQELVEDEVISKRIFDFTSRFVTGAVIGSASPEAQKTGGVLSGLHSILKRQVTDMLRVMPETYLQSQYVRTDLNADSQRPTNAPEMLLHFVKAHNLGKLILTKEIAHTLPDDSVLIIESQAKTTYATKDAPTITALHQILRLMQPPVLNPKTGNTSQSSQEIVVKAEEAVMLQDRKIFPTIVRATKITAPNGDIISSDEIDRTPHSLTQSDLRKFKEALSYAHIYDNTQGEIR